MSTQSGKDNTARLALVGLLVLAIAFALHVNRTMENDKAIMETINNHLEVAEKASKAAR